MNKNTIIPQSWRESLSELKEEISQKVEHWLGRLKPEERREAEQELALSDFWRGGLDFSFSQPRVNLEEDDDALKVTVEIPGLRKEDLRIDLDGRLLTIHGHKEEITEKKAKGRSHISELRYGSFTRQLVLPCDVEKNLVDAKYRRGVLKLTLPKTEEAKARSIEITFED